MFFTCVLGLCSFLHRTVILVHSQVLPVFHFGFISQRFQIILLRCDKNYITWLKYFSEKSFFTNFHFNLDCAVLSQMPTFTAQQGLVLFLLLLLLGRTYFLLKSVLGILYFYCYGEEELYLMIVLSSRVWPFVEQFLDCKLESPGESF